MNSHVIYIAFIAFLAWDHLSYVAAVNAGISARRGGEKHQHPNEDSDESKDDLAKYCTLREAEEKTFEVVSGGFKDIFSLLRSLLRQRCSKHTLSKKDIKDQEAEIAVTRRKTCDLFNEGTSPSFGSIAKMQPKSENAVQKAQKIAINNFANATNLILDALNLPYSNDLKNVVYKIDSLEPESVAMFLTGVCQFFIAMRQGTPGKPVILAENVISEQRALAGTLYNFQGIFVGIRLYLHLTYYGDKSGRMPCHSSELQKLEKDLMISLRRTLKIIFDEIKQWAGLPSKYALGIHKHSCGIPSKP